MRRGSDQRCVSLSEPEIGCSFLGSDRDRDSDRGQATLEMALVLPLLVLCIAGIVWVGQVMLLQVRLENAAREGARAAAIEPNAAASVAQAAARRSVDDISVSTSVETEFVVVTVTTEATGVPIIGLGARTLEAEVHMRREDIINN